MATCKDCKDCFHYELCGVFGYISPVECGFYKDRSRFVELPCKVGDMVYCLTLPEKRRVTRIAVTQYGLRITVNDMFSFDMSQIGKTVFFTKEEAEQALKEREENDKQKRPDR